MQRDSSPLHGPESDHDALQAAWNRAVDDAVEGSPKIVTRRLAQVPAAL